MTSSVFDQVRALAADLFGVPQNQINAASSPDTIEAWDSTQHLNLVLAVEERFNLQLSPAEIEQMKTIADVARLIEAKLATAAS